MDFVQNSCLMCLCHLERLLQHQHFIPPVNKWSNKINYYNSYSYILLCYCRAVAVMLCSVFNLVLLIPLILDLQGAGKLDQEALYITYYCGCVHQYKKKVIQCCIRCTSIKTDNIPNQIVRSSPINSYFRAK